jgi:site-specific DNA recombinase
VSLLSGLLVCESCGSRFIAVNKFYYGCASYKQRGLAACSNTARVKRPHVEALILAEVESEILSDEAVARPQKAFQAELSRFATRDKAEPPVTQKLAKLGAEADELRAMLKAGSSRRALSRLRST